MYEQYNKETARAEDRVAYALCQIIDDDAPMRWTRFRMAANCIAKNSELMRDLKELKTEKRVASDDFTMVDFKDE